MCGVLLGAMAIGLVGMAVCEEVVCSMFRICNRINEGWLQSEVTAIQPYVIARPRRPPRFIHYRVAPFASVGFTQYHLELTQVLLCW